MPSTLVLNQPLPLSAIELGRLVRDALYPENEFYQPVAPDNEQREESQGETRQRTTATVDYKLDNLRETLERSRGTRLEATLLDMLQLIWHVNESQIRATIGARHSTVRQLRDPDGFFETACRDDEGVRAWIEEQARRPQRRRQGGHGIFLVCGLKVLTDARVEQVASQRSGVEATLSIPVAAVAAGLPIPAGLGLDVGAGVAVTAGQGGEAAYTVIGDFVYAVQYRKIRFSRFSTRSAGNAYLDKGNYWRSYLIDRADEDEDEEGEEDGISAEVAEPPQTTDLDGGVFECLDVDGEEIMYEVDYGIDEG
jgi:hypothetical protein